VYQSVLNVNSVIYTIIVSGGLKARAQLQPAGAVSRDYRATAMPEAQCAP